MIKEDLILLPKVNEPSESVSHLVMSDSLKPCEAPQSMEFSRQEYWSELPFPSPGDLPHSGIELVSPVLQVDSLPLSHLRNLKSPVELVN